MDPKILRMRSILLDVIKSVDPKDLFVTLVPEANSFVLGNPYAFSLATCLDRGTKAEIIWTIPYWMHQRLGHLDPNLIYRFSIDKLTRLVDQLPKKPRYVDAAPRTIQELTKIVVERYGGDAARIWTNKSAVEVRKTFLSIYGVGRGIANMAVLLIEKAYGIRFSDLDHTRMDIKPDVNTMRVLYRMGVAAAIMEDEAINAARYLNPSFPGEIDSALWLIGRQWCTAQNPVCHRCPMNEVCPKVLH